METLTFVIHGDPGTGKSWLADTAPGPRLVLDAEGGAKFTPSPKVEWTNVNDAPPELGEGVETVVVKIRDLKTLQSVFTWLNRGQHPFRSVIIDSLSEVQKRAVDEIAGVEQMRTQDWGALLRKGESLVRAFRDLTMHPANPVACVVFVCLTAERGDQKVQQRPYLQGQLGTSLPGFVDVVGYLAVELTEDGLVRRLKVQPYNGTICKDRTGKLGDYVDNPNITEMFGTVYEKEKEGAST